MKRFSLSSTVTFFIIVESFGSQNANPRNALELIGWMEQSEAYSLNPYGARSIGKRCLNRSSMFLTCEGC